MPNCTRKIGDKFRVVECLTGKLVKNKAGTAVDGGGFRSAARAKSQAVAINISQHKRKKK